MSGPRHGPCDRPNPLLETKSLLVGLPEFVGVERRQWSVEVALPPQPPATMCLGPTILSETV